MPDETQPNATVPQIPNATPASSSTPATSPLEYRFSLTDAVPGWAQGKSIAEVLQVSERMAQALSGANPTPSPASPAVPPADARAVTDDDFLTRPLESFNRAADEFARLKIAPVLAQIATSNAQAARSIAARDESQAFAKWGPEIDALMAANVPVEQRTVDTYAKVVSFVKGQHLDEIVTEKLNERLAQVGGIGERSTGSLPGVSSPVALANLDDEWKSLMQRAKLTETDVRDFCRKNDLPIEQWAEMVKSGKVVTSVSPFQFEVTKEALGVSRDFSD